MSKIFTLTMNPTIDKSTEVEEVLPEHKLRCEVPQYDAGGGGINVARAIRNLKGESEALYCAGGPPGEMLRHLLEQEGVAQRCFDIKGWTRIAFTVTESKTNKQFRFLMPGPEVTEAEWKHCLDSVIQLDPKPEYFVASGSLPRGVPEDFYAQLAEKLKSVGTKLVLDTSGRPMAVAVEAGVYLIKPNRRELGKILGKGWVEEKDIQGNAMKLIKRKQSEVVVVSMGEQGAMLISEKKVKKITAPKIKAKSRVGAGDSMVGGMVVSLASGKSVEEAVQYGVAAGTAAALTSKTQLCRHEDTERLYKGIVG